MPLLGFLVLAQSCSLLSYSAALAQQKPSADPARLLVLIVFDQMRADYLERWQELFGDKGFQRLQQEGIWFQNCHYPYADTVTGTGHASLSTGCCPATHGIVGNDWYDRATGKSVNCVSAERPYDRIPRRETSSTFDLVDKKNLRSVSPERLLVPTAGDLLKEATGGKARVVSLSLKDRSAVLPGGHHPDACYWFDTNTGTFVTSSYYRDRLHPWVEEWNRNRLADRWFGQNWDRSRPSLDYVRYSGPDDVEGEATGFLQGRTFPHPMTGGLKKPGRLYYEAVTTSPFGNDILLDLTKRAIDAEKLGQRDVPDLLCVSFSSNDLIGHCWGPDSQEVLDVTLRSDIIMADLLSFLDARVGKGRYLLALTADHGVCPLPEVARSQGKDAGRIDASPLVRKADEYLARMFGSGSGKSRWVESVSAPWFYLNRRLLADQNVEAAKVEEALAGWLKSQPGILTAYTRTQLKGKLPTDDKIGESVQRGFHSDRSGDVVAVVKPYYLLSTLFTTGTNHGTPHAYDTRVPLLVFGRGVKPLGKPCQEAVTPLAIASIFTSQLGIKPPSHADFPVPVALSGRHRQ
jgi:hypothetical protein